MKEYNDWSLTFFYMGFTCMILFKCFLVVLSIYLFGLYGIIISCPLIFWVVEDIFNFINKLIEVKK